VRQNSYQLLNFFFFYFIYLNWVGLNGYPLKQTGRAVNGFFWGGSLNGAG
jgi:hypothetical protein